MKFLGESEWKRKKHGPEYRRQWRKLHIGIDSKTLQIRAVQLTTNNVSNSQVLGDLLNEPYRVCRRVNILRDYPDDKTKLYPRN